MIMPKTWEMPIMHIIVTNRNNLLSNKLKKANKGLKISPQKTPDSRESAELFSDIGRTVVPS